jgi:CBS domain containing-hemolysin-like protein
MIQNLLLFVVPICLATSFLCAGMEAGIFALGRWRIAQQMREGKQRAARLYSYLQDTENFLWTILVGNTLAAFGALWIIGVALINTISNPLEFWPAYLAVVFVFYALCDLLPKMLFRAFPNRLCLLMSAPFRLLHLFLAPGVSIIENLANLLLRWTGGRIFKGHVFSNRNELRLMMEDSTQSLSSEERGMITRVFDLQNINVRQIAIPFTRFASLNANDLIGDALSRFRETPLNFIPVWSESRDRRLAGFLNLKQILFQERIALSEPIEKYLSAPLYLDEDMRVQEALRRMQRSGSRIAVVTARDRRELGLIRLEEILKVIFGEVKF